MRHVAQKTTDHHLNMIFNIFYLIIFQTPAYDLLSSDVHHVSDKNATGNNMAMADIIRIIDGILW